MTEPIRNKHLLDLIYANPKHMVEVTLLISRFFMGTHFIYFNGRNLYDEGIDGEKRKVSKEEFLKNYRNNYWLVDNII